MHRFYTFFIFIFIIVTSCESNDAFDDGLPEFEMAKPCEGLSYNIYDNGISLGIIDYYKISEASGLIASRINKDCYYTHNDKGNKSIIFVLNNKGEIKNQIEFDKSSLDIEDVATYYDSLEKKSYLYIGDIGDNDNNRAYISILKVEEPELNAEYEIDLKIQSEIKLKFPSGSHDAEAFFIDPTYKILYLISKKEKYSKLYSINLNDITDEINTLKYVGVFPFRLTTSADISHDGKRLLVRNKTNIYLWENDSLDTIEKLIQTQPKCIPFIPEPQGEGICFESGNYNFLTISEYKNNMVPKLYKYYKSK